MKIANIQYNLGYSFHGPEDFYYFICKNLKLDINLILPDQKLNKIINKYLMIPILIIILSDLGNIMSGKRSIFKSIEIVDYKNQKRLIIKDSAKNFRFDKIVNSEITKEFVILNYNDYTMYITKIIEDKDIDTNILDDLVATNPWNINLNDYDNIKSIMLFDNNTKKKCLVII